MAGIHTGPEELPIPGNCPVRLMGIYAPRHGLYHYEGVTRGLHIFRCGDTTATWPVDKPLVVGREPEARDDDDPVTYEVKPAPTPDSDLDLVGTSEAARIAGITVRAVQQHHHRGTMPEPVPVAGSDVLVWERSAIEEWAEQRAGRGRPAHSG